MLLPPVAGAADAAATERRHRYTGVQRRLLAPRNLLCAVAEPTPDDDRGEEGQGLVGDAHDEEQAEPRPGLGDRAKQHDGGEYRGEWVDGKHHGKGTLSLPSGHIYTGNWSRGKKSGFGVQTDDSGQRYAGEWSDGRQHGVGTITHRSGDSYSGQWQAGVPHGNGVMTKKGGLAISGTWLDGKKQASWAMAQAAVVEYVAAICSE